MVLISGQFLSEFSHCLTIGYGAYIPVSLELAVRVEDIVRPVTARISESDERL